MRQWWTSNLSTFSSLAFSKTDFRQLVSDSRLSLRYGIIDTLNFIRRHDIPMVVVSGGLKPIIDEALT
jgi:2-hydroxy-3-keto-5-methylthiopentenyl-1-phosphate phosphatase